MIGRFIGNAVTWTAETAIAQWLSGAKKGATKVGDQPASADALKAQLDRIQNFQQRLNASKEKLLIVQSDLSAKSGILEVPSAIELLTAEQKPSATLEDFVKTMLPHFTKSIQGLQPQLSQLAQVPDYEPAKKLCDDTNNLATDFNSSLLEADRLTKKLLPFGMIGDALLTKVEEKASDLHLPLPPIAISETLDNWEWKQHAQAFKQFEEVSNRVLDALTTVHAALQAFKPNLKAEAHSSAASSSSTVVAARLAAVPPSTTMVPAMSASPAPLPNVSSASVVSLSALRSAPSQQTQPVAPSVSTNCRIM